MTAALYYVGGPNPDNRQELRYSLRSVEQNAPDITDVWIVGDVPNWATGCNTISLTPQPEKFANQRASITAFVNHPDAPDTFYLFNDDHFITEHVAGQLPTHHCGPAAPYIAKLCPNGRTSNTWVKALRDTTAWLTRQGYAQPNAYVAHTPTLYDTAALRDALNEYPSGQRVEPCQMYAAAGANGEGTDTGNAKVKQGDNLQAKLTQPMPYLSTNPHSWPGEAGKYLRTMFPTPSKWEQ